MSEQNKHIILVPNSNGQLEPKELTIPAHTGISEHLSDTLEENILFTDDIPTPGYLPFTIKMNN